MPTTQELFDAILTEEAAADSVAALLGANPDLANMPNENGLSPLKFSLYCRRPDLAKLILEAGATTDIFEAAALGELDKLTALLDTQPNALAAHDGDGFMILHLACFFGHVECVRFLIGREADVTAVVKNPTLIRPIHSGAAGGSAEIVTLLLEAGAEADTRQHHDYTALMAAAMHNNLDMAKALLEAGANPNQKSEDDRTPISMAQEAGHEEMVKMLKKAGGNEQ